MSHVFISASALVVSLIVCFKDSQAQSSDRYSSVPSDLATAAVIQATEKRLRPLNGVTTNRNHNQQGVERSPVYLSEVDMSASDMVEDGGLDNLLVSEEENYWREVKAIIGGVLGFWGGVGGLGTIFLVIVLSQRYCCKEDDSKDDGDG